MLLPPATTEHNQESFDAKATSLKRHKTFQRAQQGQPRIHDNTFNKFDLIMEGIKLTHNIFEYNINVLEIQLNLVSSFILICTIN